VDDFEAEIKAALRADGEHERRRRRELAEAHSWTARVREIGDLVGSSEKAPAGMPTSAP
jgi:hypothetical protein